MPEEPDDADGGLIYRAIDLGRGLRRAELELIQFA